MKKIVTFGVAFAAAATVLANTIDWEYNNVLDKNGNSFASDYEIVFLTDAPGSDGLFQSPNLYNGSNADVAHDTDVDTGTAYVSGTWTDESPSPNYYVAVFSNGKYYAVDDGTGNPVQYQYSTPDNALEPALPGQTSGSFKPDANSTAEHRTIAVPEPATALLALAGVAMLIRRRKA